MLRDRRALVEIEFMEDISGFSMVFFFKSVLFFKQFNLQVTKKSRDI